GGSNTIDGGDGIDIVDFAVTKAKLFNAKINVNGFTSTLAGIERASLAGGAGDDLIDASLFIGRSTLSGLGGNDTLLGGSAKDLLDGGAGEDSLNGGGGNGAIFGNSGNNTLTRGTGNDALPGDDVTHPPPE